MSVNIRDIAKECRVSKSTVSRVLNNDSAVKQETRDKILAAMGRLKYDPINNIPFLKNIRIRSLGLVLSREYEEMAPFFQRAITTFKSATSKNGFEGLFYTQEEIGDLLARPIPDRSLDGLIFFCPHTEWDPLLRKARKAGIPCVLIRRTTDVEGVIIISDDDYEGGRMLLDFLDARGYTHIARDADVKFPYIDGRNKAYIEFHGRHGRPVEDALQWDSSRAAEMDREQWISDLMASSHPPDCFCCSSDQTAVTTIKILKKLGFRVPEDVAVTGYDDDYVAELFSPGITTVKIPVREMIYLGVKMLADICDGMKLGVSVISVKNELVVRESCGGKR